MLPIDAFHENFNLNQTCKFPYHITLRFRHFSEQVEKYINVRFYTWKGWTYRTLFFLRRSILYCEGICHGLRLRPYLILRHDQPHSFIKADMVTTNLWSPLLIFANLLLLLFSSIPYKKQLDAKTILHHYMQ